MSHAASADPAPRPLNPWARLGCGGTILFGGLHALSSLYWGLGGPALVETVGQGAVELRREAPPWLFVMLLGVGAVKAIAVAVPIANARGHLPWPRLWRVLSWLGAVGLVVYGGGYTVLAHLALAGAFGPPSDPVGLRGHGFLWSPLFAAWGLSLLLALATDRGAHPRDRATRGTGRRMQQSQRSSRRRAREHQSD